MLQTVAMAGTHRSPSFCAGSATVAHTVRVLACAGERRDAADRRMMVCRSRRGVLRRGLGRPDDLALLFLESAAALGGTFHQDGQCVYADDRVAINVIHESGGASSGQPFDNVAIYVSRLRSDGKTDRVWTVDLDAEHCEEFWKANPGAPSKDFS
jgi:hypothetical protein